MTDFATLAATLLANFRTVHIPASERREEPPADWWAKAKARWAEHRAAYACRDSLLKELVDHGYRRFLHHLEPDPEGGWRLHILVADEAALPLLDELTKWVCSPGDPAAFNPQEFVAGRLRDLLPYCLDGS